MMGAGRASNHFRLFQRHARENVSKTPLRKSIVPNFTAGVHPAGNVTHGFLEFEPSLKRQHAWRTVSTQTDTQQTRGRRGRICQRSKAHLRGGFAWHSGQHQARQSKIGMVKNIEELSVKSQLHSLREGKPFRQVEITPEEIRSAQRVASQVSELAIRRTIPPVAGPGARIDGGRESVRVEPLDGSGLRHVCKETVFV